VKRTVMPKIGAAVLCLGCNASHGTEVPKQIEVTPEMQQIYGFHVAVEADSGDVVAEVTYPASIDSVWTPSGTVVVQMSQGHQSFISRTDFSAADSKRTVIVGIPIVPTANDVIVAVIYRCAVDTDKCKRDDMVEYLVTGIRRFLVPAPAEQ
jgi:hypothetical protein